MTRGTSDNLQNHAIVSLLTIKMVFPGCSTLKEKRGRLHPILARLRKEFNAGFAETGLQDVWQAAWISCALVSNSNQLNNQTAGEILKYIEIRYPDEVIESHQLVPI